MGRQGAERRVSRGGFQGRPVALFSDLPSAYVRTTDHVQHLPVTWRASARKQLRRIATPMQDQVLDPGGEANVESLIPRERWVVMRKLRPPHCFLLQMIQAS